MNHCFTARIDDGRLGAPAVRVIVPVFLLGEEEALVLQDCDDERVRLEDVLAVEFRNARLPR